MEPRIGETYSGVISGITGWGVYVELPDTVEGMIRISDLTDDFYAYDEKQYILVGEYTGRIFTLGQKMDVMVAGVDTMRRTIDFVPVQDGESTEAPGRDRVHESYGLLENDQKALGGKSSHGSRSEHSGKSSHSGRSEHSSESDRSGKSRKKKGPLMDRTGRVLSGRAGKLRGKKSHKGKRGRR
jgi:ribonuclease R